MRRVRAEDGPALLAVRSATEENPFKVEALTAAGITGVRRALWSRGYATEIGRMLLKYGVEQLRLSKIVAAINPRNDRSMRVIHKLLFRYRKKVDWPLQGKVNYYTFEASPGSSPVTA